MGRLEVKITHGHDHGGPAQWGAVVALIAFVLLAAAGHKEIGAFIHEVLTIVAITALSLAGLTALAVTAVIVTRTRAARRARARRVIPVAPGYRVRVEPASDRPALGTPRHVAGWPRPGQWEESIPRGERHER